MGARCNPVPSVLMLNTVPFQELPPLLVVPYKVVPDNKRPANGYSPSSPVKNSIPRNRYRPC